MPLNRSDGRLPGLMLFFMAIVGYVYGLNVFLSEPAQPTLGTIAILFASANLIFGWRTFRRR